MYEKVVFEYLILYAQNHKLKKKKIFTEFVNYYTMCHTHA